MEDLHLSFEFFPTKTEAGTQKLLNNQQHLSAFEPDFYSMTYGAGGSTQAHTLELVEHFIKTNIPVVPHLSCIGQTKADIQHLIQHYQNLGVDTLVVLRGDLPSGIGFHHGDFRYASDLVTFIKDVSGDHFDMYVAAYPEVHPQAHNYDQDLDAFAAKVNAGATGAMTQFFFNPDSYFYYIEALNKKQIEVPVIPGIMPIGNYSKLARFSDACGAEIPRWVRRRLEAYGDDLASIRAFGIDVVTQLCDDLLSNDAPGLHFYTLNDATLSSQILTNLGW